MSSIFFSEILSLEILRLTRQVEVYDQMITRFFDLLVFVLRCNLGVMNVMQPQAFGNAADASNFQLIGLVLSYEFNVIGCNFTVISLVISATIICLASVICC